MKEMEEEERKGIKIIIFSFSKRIPSETDSFLMKKLWRDETKQEGLILEKDEENEKKMREG